MLLPALVAKALRGTNVMEYTLSGKTMCYFHTFMFLCILYVCQNFFCGCRSILHVLVYRYTSAHTICMHKHF